MPSQLDAIAQRVMRSTLAAGTAEHPGGQFAKGGGRVPADPSLQQRPKLPEHVRGTRAQLIARLRETGYTGPTSYSMTRLREIAAGHYNARAGVRIPTPTPTPIAPTPTPAPTTPAAPRPGTTLAEYRGLTHHQVAEKIRNLEREGFTEEDMLALYRSTPAGSGFDDAHLAAWHEAVAQEAQRNVGRTYGSWYERDALKNATGMAVTQGNLNLDGMTRNQLLALQRDVGISFSRTSQSVGDLRSEMSNSIARRARAPIEYLATQDRARANAARILEETTARAARAEAARASLSSAVWQGKTFTQMNDSERAKFMLDTWEGTHGGLTVKSGVEIPSGNTFNGAITNASGSPVGTVTRTISADGKSVHHAYLQISRSEQGSGFATSFNAKAIKNYKDAGIQKVTVHANIDVGGYTWARQGFSLAPTNANGRIRSTLHSRINSLESAGTIDGTTATTMRRQLEAGDMFGLTTHRAPAYKTGGTISRPGVRGQIARIEKIPGKSKNVKLILSTGEEYTLEDSEPYLKSAMLGADWYGELDITKPLKNKALVRA